MKQLLGVREIVAFAIAPLACSLPLLPWFAIPGSPLFLGKLVAEHNMSAGFAAFAVIFDGTLLGYCMELVFALPIYLLLRALTVLTVCRFFILAGSSGVLGSIVVVLLNNFRQPALRAFAESALSPVLGALCGLISAVVFWSLTRQTVSNYKRSK